MLWKNKYFLNWLGELLQKVLEMPDGKQRVSFFIRLKEKKGGEYEQEIIAKDINKLIDFHESYGSPLGGLDIFYGNERVYLILADLRILPF